MPNFLKKAKNDKLPKVNSVPEGLEVDESPLRLIEWVDKTLHTHEYTHLKEMCSGIAYCEILAQMFPDVMKKSMIVYKPNKKECIKNFQCIQKMFQTLKIDKNIPIKSIVEGDFKDSYEFLIWFRKFCEANSVKEGIIKKPSSRSSATNE